MKNAISALLKENHKALQFLHAAAGFDFEKPFMIYQGQDRFTFNQITKEIKNQLPGEVKAVMLVKPTPAHYMQRLYYIRLTHTRFEGTRPDGFPFSFDIDYFCGVGDLEEMRKYKTATYWVIAQAVEHLYPSAEPKAFDAFTRYTITGHITRATDPTRCQHWLSSIPLTNKERNERPREFKPFEAYSFKMAERNREDLADYVDKSGYLVFLRRRELRRAAEALRAERNKAAALKANYSQREMTIFGKIANGKTQLHALTDPAATSEDFAKIKEIVSALELACYYLAYYKRKKAEGRYASPKAMENDLDYIEKYLDKIA